MGIHHITRGFASRTNLPPEAALHAAVARVPRPCAAARHARLAVASDSGEKRNLYLLQSIIMPRT